jgi:sulfur-carrier protein adenylyltransferase/sulfurtransferase
VRSRAAASILGRAGFKEVYSMEGGIHAWNGRVAKGAPEAGMAHFAPASRIEELIALAWLLEEGSRKFYGEIEGTMKDLLTQNLFHTLGTAEERHKETLLATYLETMKLSADPNFPGSVISNLPPEDYLEGGIRLRAAVEWAKGSSPKEILEFSIAQEVNAQDLYLKMERAMGDPQAVKIFRSLAEEEKSHLDRLTVQLDKSL